MLRARQRKRVAPQGGQVSAQTSTLATQVSSCLLASIFSFIGDASSLAAVEAVCKTWRIQPSSPTAWNMVQRQWKIVHHLSLAEDDDDRIESPNNKCWAPNWKELVRRELKVK